ncbi:interleukin-6-like [Thomomys bottae]
MGIPSYGQDRTIPVHWGSTLCSLRRTDSTFRPLAFVGLLLVAASAFPTSGVSTEGHASVQQAEDRMSFALMKIKELKREICNNEVACVQSEYAISEKRLNVPKITPEDGCFETRFKEDTCLLKIISGLLQFQIHLRYIRDKFQGNDGQKVEDVINSTENVVELLKQETNQDEIIWPSTTANAELLDKLQSQKEWRKGIVIHFILRSLEDFLQHSVRAIRYL